MKKDPSDEHPIIRSFSFHTARLNGITDDTAPGLLALGT